MRREVHTRCLLHNVFARDLRFPHIPAATFRRFFDLVGKEISDHGYVSEAMDLLDVPAQHDSSLLRQGRIVPTIETPTVSRVMSAFDLGKRHGGALGLDYSRDKSEHFIVDRISSGRLTAASLRDELRGKQPFAWVTRSEVIANLRAAAPDDPATPVRDFLGLKGYEDRHVQLIEVLYPEDFAEKFELRVPTTLDAGSSVYFRPHDESDGWGRTIDLRSLDPGAPEALAPATAVNSNFKLTVLGAVKAYSPAPRYAELLRKSRELLLKDAS